MRIVHRVAPLALVLLLFVAAACTKKQRTETLRASLITVAAAKDTFFEWDKKQQIEIAEKTATMAADRKLTKAEAHIQVHAALETYRKDKDTVLFAIDQVLTYISFAALQDDTPSLSAALKGAADLVEAISNFKKRHDQTGGP